MEENKPSKFKKAARVALAIVSGLIVFLSLGYWMLSIYDRSEKIQVVVAATDLEAPRALKADDLTLAYISRGVLPRTAVADLKSVVGVTLISSMSAKEVLTTNHLAKGIEASSESLLLADDAFGFSLPTAWLAGPPPKVAANDRIQILASAADQPVETGTFFIGESLLVLKVDKDKDGNPVSMLLEVDAIDAAEILQARANKLALAVIVEPAPIEAD